MKRSLLIAVFGFILEIPENGDGLEKDGSSILSSRAVSNLRENLPNSSSGERPWERMAAKVNKPRPKGCSQATAKEEVGV